MNRFKAFVLSAIVINLPLISFARVVEPVPQLNQQVINFLEVSENLRKDWYRIHDSYERSALTKSAQNTEECETQLKRLQRVLDGISKGSEIRIGLSNGHRFVVSVQCENQEIDARTSYGLSQFTAGLMRFFKTDDGLAFVVAHELSHHLLIHDLNPYKVPLKQRELSADRLAGILIVNAGYHLSGAESALVRLDSEIQRQLNGSAFSNPYPSLEERTSAVREVIAAP